MNWISARRAVGACLVFICIGGASAALAQGTTPSPTPTPGATAAAPQQVVNEEVVVSATKMAQDPVDIAGDITVVSGDELRRRGTTTLAQALQDVVGLDTGEGSDNGPRLPNIGLYGIKEFDALMVTVDGFRSEDRSIRTWFRCRSKTSTASKSRAGPRVRCTASPPSPA